MSTEWEAINRLVAEARAGIDRADAAITGLERLLATVPEPGPEPEPGIPELVLATADAEWKRPVAEPPGANSHRIDEYIRGGYGLRWTWVPEYEADGDFAWCGAFAAYCYGVNGLNADVRLHHFASTRRLVKWARDTPRMVPPDDVSPGDIVIVGSEGSRYGEHITLATEVHPDLIHTVEGNAWGSHPNGSHVEGVVTHQRPWTAGAPSAYRFRYAIRPLMEDYV